MTDQNAVVFPMGGYCAVKEIEQIPSTDCKTSIDQESGLWKGKIVDTPGSPVQGNTVIFRRYYDEKNEFDRAFPEVFLSAEVLGYDLWLIPKEKLVCAYLKTGSIHLPKQGVFSMKRRPFKQ